jgi:hypothetical protein
MQMIIGIASLALAAYGFTQAGVFGILTGIVAGFGVGSGLSIFTAHEISEVSTSTPERAAQRLGGLVAIVACAAGVYFGGWTFGSVFGLAGYFAGMLTTLLLASVARGQVTRENP